MIRSRIGIVNNCSERVLTGWNGMKQHDFVL